MKVELVIPEAYPGLNTTINWHFAVRLREKARWWALIRAAMGSQAIPKPQQGELRRVTVDRYSTHRMDRANLYGGAKYIIEDNLRLPRVTRGIYKTGKRKGQPWLKQQIGVGLIFDDDDAHCDLKCNHVSCRKGEERTVITIEL